MDRAADSAARVDGAPVKPSPTWGSAEQENIACERIAEDVAAQQTGGTGPVRDGVEYAASMIAARIRARRQERGPQPGQAF